MSFLLGKKSASAPVIGATTPRTSGVADPVFEPISDEPHLVGHPGYLTESHNEALKAFTELLAKAGLYSPASEDGTVEASPDEATLLRFLRARSFQPEAALAQFQSANEWRKQHDVENLFASGFTAEEFEDTKRFYPRWTGRRDKHGLPLFVYRISALEPLQKELDAIPAERRYQRIIGLYEQMIKFSFRLCSYLPHPTSPLPVSASTSIIDLGDASFSSMFRLRNHFQEASKLATANYPETLGSIVIVNAPSFFPTVWSWIKGWFDEGTRNKIHILSKDPQSLTTLSTLIKPKDLPKIYGGELDWTFVDEPNLDEEAKAVLGEMPKGPAVFNLKTGKVEKPTTPVS
ncbi:CRAL-TRIO domain-containing protein [Ephemerocybe angulata]|uniref:CRAL-TRIO domain-containing protein n=1 Tax=Ephemerocybe angulata TaxID=980116 RepID=A0A8H6HZ76_9AGAR|nr:CRAL-TRIO domain-containing protein [Tulosesus angulatus]